MREGWKIKPLEDVCHIQQGKTLAISKLSSGEYPVYGANGIVGYFDEYNFEFPVTGLGCRGSCGTIHFIKNKAFLANNVMAIWEKNPKELNADYLPLAISQVDLISTGAISGQVQPQITKQSLGPVKLSIPPLIEQVRIVDLISSVDHYIDALAQQVESARRSRNAVLHEMLIAGGDDWTETTLPDVVENLDRLRKPISAIERETRLGNVPYYGANGQTGFIDQHIFNETLVLLGEDAIDFLNPQARKAYMISGPSWVNNHAHVLRAIATKVHPFFLTEALNAVDFSQYVSFGTRSKLTQASMNGIKLWIPPLAQQKTIVDLISSMDYGISATENLISETKKLRTGLLSDLLSGDHEIPESYDEVMVSA